MTGKTTTSGIEELETLGELINSALEEAGHTNLDQYERKLVSDLLRYLTADNANKRRFEGEVAAFGNQREWELARVVHATAQESWPHRLIMERYLEIGDQLIKHSLDVILQPSN